MFYCKILFILLILKNIYRIYNIRHSHVLGTKIRPGKMYFKNIIRILILQDVNFKLNQTNFSLTHLYLTN
jgi:hypothetical protein